MKRKTRMSVGISRREEYLEKNRMAFISIPAFKSEYENALHKIRAEDGDKLEVYLYPYPLIPHWDAIRLSNETTIEELNYFAQRLSELNEEQVLALNGIIAYRQPRRYYENGISGRELIALTYGLDDINIVHKVWNDKSFGQKIIAERQYDYMLNMTEKELNSLDPCEIARETREKEEGTYLVNMYVPTKKYKPQEIDYSGAMCKCNKDHYIGVMKLLMSRTKQEALSSETENKFWITVPASRTECERIARLVGRETIDDCWVSDVISALPGIDVTMFSKRDKFEYINKLALAYLGMEKMDKIKLKAIIQRECPTNSKQALLLIDDMPLYELEYYIDDEGIYGTEYMRRMLPDNFDIDAFDRRGFSYVGKILMEKLNIFKSDYGIISQKGHSLYEGIYKEQSHEEKEEIEMGGMQM